MYFYDGRVMKVTRWINENLCYAVAEYEPDGEWLYCKQFVEEHKISIFESQPREVAKL